jgi:DNA-binding transcriptional ArsR family regulator
MQSLEPCVYKNIVQRLQDWASVGAGGGQTGRGAGAVNEPADSAEAVRDFAAPVPVDGFSGSGPLPSAQATGASSPGRGVSPQRVAREKFAAIVDPLRLALITALGRSPSTSTQLAAELDADPRKIRYLLRRMRAVGLVDLAGTRTRGRSRENVYSVQPVRFVLRDDEVAWIKPHEVDRAIATLVRLMFHETSAVIGGTSSRTREDLVRRFPMSLDRQGWVEAAALHRSAIGRAMEVGEKSLDRLAESGAQTIESLAMVLFFPLVTEVEYGGGEGQEAQMTSLPGARKRTSVRRLQAAVDPVRVATLESLMLRAGSASAVAAELNLPIGKVRYQLQRLQAEGLIRVESERRRRGAIERAFIADPRRVAEHEARLVAKVPEARRLLRQPAVRAIFGGALEAIRAGKFHREHDYVVARAPLSLDARGYEEIRTILLRTLESLFVIREESLRRLENEETSPSMAISALLHLEQVG